jgi:acyl-[acyl-carrier-protein]-phospholipid O-acyltransferase/long-chain-fatty-acid--[acyl-carrier-protein] ligase
MPPINPPRAFLRQCRGSLRRGKIADSMGEELTGGSLLMRTLILRRILGREVLAPSDRYVGLLLPPSNGAVLANAAVTLSGRIPVNLNYTVSAETMNSCLAQCGIRHVLTSRRVMEKLKVELAAELVYLEDFRNKVTLADKIVGAIGGYVTPLGLLERRLGVSAIKPDDVMTVVFTSGSTGEPKGVMLTYDNIGSNIEAIDQVIRLTADDVALGILPFFHSFGFTVPLWTVLSLPLKGVYHFNPLDAKEVGKLCRKHRVTVLLATPTFLRTYLRRVEPEDFASLEVVVVGAEKLPAELADAFEAKFGVRPVEGYGVTELSPLVSVNIPPGRSPHTDRPTSKQGTVGPPVQGVSAKVVDPDTGKPLAVGEPGMLLVTGRNVMKGYLNKPDKTAEVIRDGWYVTGDIARIDADGFIEITDRASRFSKIGGEMIPHIKVEDTLKKVIAAGEDEVKAVVTAVPDATRGERLIVIHTHLDKAPDQITKEMARAGLPNLWIPSPDSFLEVPEIPVLGTGKLDLKALRQLALEKFGKKP